MKKIILLLILILVLPGCFNLTASGYGVFEIDPGVRIYKTETDISIHITYKKEQIPKYEEISLIIKEVLNESCK